MPKSNALGKSVIRALKKRSTIVKDGYRHTSDLPDGRDFNRINLKSVTEQTSLDTFLDIAALAENDFVSEFSDVKIVDRDSSNGILTEDEKALIASVQEDNKEILCIPRRPHWESSMSKEVLDALERESFLVWRRKLALVQEEQNLSLTPYEKNLEVWRQLWRVVERSDVVVQIIDARNPLLFRCPDLEVYVKELDERKRNVLLLNKADFLTEDQRKSWCEYFEETNVQIVFFSALEQINRSQDEDKVMTCQDVLDNVDPSRVKNNPKILSREELVSFFKSIPHYRSSEGVATIGLVGYPNVGKSSTLNAILLTKRKLETSDETEPTKERVCSTMRVSVSATPGKTKHFQTFIITRDLCLCDCPGLVFPNFVSTKAEMVINGILPIDQLTNWVQPVSIITSIIPKHILEHTYSILIPTPGEDRDPNAPPTAEEFLNAHGYNRGFMTQRGLPDNARSSRYILKDFVNGKLLYCHAPPGVKQEDYHKFPNVKPKKTTSNVTSADVENKEAILTEADKRFFAKSSGVRVKGKGPVASQDGSASTKPWRKHNNKNKKEKLRRIYRNPYE